MQHKLYEAIKLNYYIKLIGIKKIDIFNYLRKQVKQLFKFYYIKILKNLFDIYILNIIYLEK